MTQTFYHSEGCNSATVEFGGRKVLYSIKTPSKTKYDRGLAVTVDRHKYIIVAGYVVGDYAKIQMPGNKIRVTEVEPITDKSERKELTDLLRETEKTTNFSFWG